MREPSERVGGGYPTDLVSCLDPQESRTARSAIRRFPDYSPTPLIEMSGAAEEFGIGRLYYKDESVRFGVGSFKALGGLYAVRQAVEQAKSGSELVLCCASAGNHGAGIAYAAKQFGCRCVVFTHRNVTQCRREAIAQHGAEVIRLDMTYDQSVAHAKITSEREGWTLVADVADETYRAIPQDIMHGYTLIVSELVEQLGTEWPPTHVVLQCGVGSFAAALAAGFWIKSGSQRPRFVIVESDQSPSLTLSLAAGRQVLSGRGAASAMLGLAADKLSLIAWPILERVADASFGLSDGESEAAMHFLSTPRGDDPPIEVGEAGAAGFGLVLAAARQPNLAQAFGFDRDSRILVVGTEGPIDRGRYTAIVR